MRRIGPNKYTIVGYVVLKAGLPLIKRRMRRTVQKRTHAVQKRTRDVARVAKRPLSGTSRGPRIGLLVALGSIAALVSTLLVQRARDDEASSGGDDLTGDASSAGQESAQLPWHTRILHVGSAHDSTAHAHNGTGSH